MEDKVLCPWCGAEMLDDAEASSNGKYVWAYMRCVSCGATSPMVENSEGAGSDENTRASARAAALRRYTPPLKPMTLEEVWKEDEPMWVEHKNGALYIGDFNASMSTKNGWDVQALVQQRDDAENDRDALETKLSELLSHVTCGRWRRMKNETKYHVATGVAGIYAGTFRADGESRKCKSEVTEEAIAAVRDYMLEHRVAFYEWKRKAGGTVRLMIEVQEEKPLVCPVNGAPCSECKPGSPCAVEVAEHG